MWCQQLASFKLKKSSIKDTNFWLLDGSFSLLALYLILIGLTGLITLRRPLNNRMLKILEIKCHCNYRNYRNYRKDYSESIEREKSVFRYLRAFFLTRRRPMTFDARHKKHAVCVCANFNSELIRRTNKLLVLYYYYYIRRPPNISL